MCEVLFWILLQEIVGNLVAHIGSGFEGEIDASLDILAYLVNHHLHRMAPFAILVKVYTLTCTTWLWYVQKKEDFFLLLVAHWVIAIARLSSLLLFRNFNTIFTQKVINMHLGILTYLWWHAAVIKQGTFICKL